MSLIHFLRTTFRPRNAGMVFFLLLNLALILVPLGAYLLYLGLTVPALIGILLLAAAAYYAIIIFCGELIIRIMFGGNRIEIGNSMDSATTAFMEAYRDAKERAPALSNNIRLYICPERFVDAFAFGRRTILLTEPAARLSPADLHVLLLEKFAQIENNDSDRLQMLIAGNCLFVVLVFIIKILVYALVAVIGIVMAAARFLLSLFFRSVRGGPGLFAFNAYLNICRILSNAVERVLMFLFNLFVRLALLSVRANYFINDRFICACGYRDALRTYLEFTAPDVTGFTSTLGSISAAKPARLSRLSRIPGHDSNAANAFQPPLPNPTGPDAVFPQPAQPTQPTQPAQPEQPAASRFRVVSTGQRERRHIVVVDRRDP